MPEVFDAPELSAPLPTSDGLVVDPQELGGVFAAVAEDAVRVVALDLARCSIHETSLGRCSIHETWAERPIRYQPNGLYMFRLLDSMMEKCVYLGDPQLSSHGRRCSARETSRLPIEDSTLTGHILTGCSMDRTV